MNELTEFYTPSEAWDELSAVRQKYVRKYSAVYSGLHSELTATAVNGSFWRRREKAKVHVPLAADIASVSSSLLFGNAPRCRIYDEHAKPVKDNGEKQPQSEKQIRLDAILRENLFESMIQEAAEIATAYGDIYLKCNWDLTALNYPAICYVGGDNAVPEYRFGRLVCVHFFTVIKTNRKSGEMWRLYERYEKGKILSAVFKGDSSILGTEIPESLEAYGIDPEVNVPGGGMMAVHIPNVKPSRVRSGDYGRSEFEGMRDLLDELDETFTSWFRDIRLAKSRLIVPVEYLRKRQNISPDTMFRGDKYTFEFDEGVETLVALDIVNDQQMMIRNIISMCGYSPQSFGLDIEGQAASGTALLIREKKSFSTRSKKLNYWSLPLERFLTSVLQLDNALYHQGGVIASDRVIVEFPDCMSTDISTMANAVKMMHDAQAASTEVKIKLLHPDWEEGEVKAEVARVIGEYGVANAAPVPGMGDLE